MPDNQFKIFTEGDDLYRDMLESIARAKSTIVLESYIFEPDSIGNSFIDALLERASDGIDVRIHLDAFGSLALTLSKQAIRIQNSSVKIKYYHPWCWYRPLRYNHRNHRKLLIIDEAVVWLGGYNIHNENSLREFGEDRWLDTHVRIDGPLASDAQMLFDQLWDKPNFLAPEIDFNGRSALITNVTWKQRRQFRQLLTRKFNAAENKLWLCTPYFMPDRFLQNQLIKTAKRGVDVRLLLPYKTDRPVARWVARSAYHSLINSGIRIFEYSPRFLHSKITLIDGQWTTIGSTNIDYRSFFINLEINLISSNASLIESLNQIFLSNLSLSEEISTKSLVQYKWLSAIYQSIGYCCRRIL